MAQTLDTSTRPDRVLTPDLARGLMLAFIALANAVLYLHGRDYGPRMHPITGEAHDAAVTFLQFLFVDGRAYPLFAVLFGYGLTQLFTRHTRAGHSAPSARRLLRRRCRWLLVFGAAHGVLLFPGDVLGTYGLIGLLLAAMMPAADRVLVWVAVCWTPVAATLLAVLNLHDGPTPERGYLWSMAVPDPALALALRPLEWLMTPVAMTGAFSAAVLGMLAARYRVLHYPATLRRLLSRTAILGIGVSVLGALPQAMQAGGLWQPTSVGAGLLASGLHGLTGIAGGLGYAALIALYCGRPRRGAVVTALAATGQRSLSCYLAQSVLFFALLAPWAGGLGATLGNASVAALAVATWALTVFAADLARRRGRRGPAETLLRRLTYRAQR